MSLLGSSVVWSWVGLFGDFGGAFFLGMSGGGRGMSDVGGMCLVAIPFCECVRMSLTYGNLSRHRMAQATHREPP